MPPILHYPFSASASKRLINCPRSRKLAAAHKNKSSIFAAEGTAAHEVGERCLRNGADADAYVDQIITVEGHDFTVTEEMAEAVQVYLDYIRGVLAQYPGAELRVEQRFNLPEIYPELGGTCDAVIVVPFHKIIVVDYKHGRGVSVDAEENTQAMIYALGAAWTEDLDEVEIVIVQPRAGRKGGGVRSWTTSRTELMTWGDTVLKSACLETEKDDAVIKAGDWCRFCPAAPTCPETRKTAMKAAEIAFDDDLLPAVANPVLLDPNAMTPAQVSKVLRLAEIIEPWITNVRAYGYDGLATGKFIPGEEGFDWKMVRGRAGNRKYADEKLAMATLMNELKQEAYEKPKIKSPKQAEDALKALAKEGKSRDLKTAKDVAALMKTITMRPEGKLSMVPLADDRPMISMGATAAFEDEPLPAAVGVLASAEDF